MGAYFRSRSGAWIELYLNNFRTRYGENALTKEPARRIALGMCLLHELGHHVSTVMEPRHARREEIASAWAQRLAPQALGLDGTPEDA